MVSNSVVTFALKAATILGVSLTLLGVTNSGALAAKCSSTGGGYAAWKPQMAAEAKAAGIGAKGIAALMATSYARATINADRNQHSFKLGLKAFLAKRGAAAIVSRGRRMKAANAALFARIEKRFGVPAGPLVAIWGMEFGIRRRFRRPEYAVGDSDPCL